MRLPPPANLQTTEGIGAYLRQLIGSITSPWAVEHQTDGRHRFEWVDVPYSASRFTGDVAMTWQVDSSDQLSLMYRYVGHDTVEIQWTIAASAVGGTTEPELRIALPDGLRAT